MKRNCRILITGITGSFAKAFVQKYRHIYNLVGMSRDEAKQHSMRLLYPDVEYLIGDVRDKERVNQVMKGIDYVFHAAALKQVPSCEFFPLEAVKTNILGTNNVIEAAKANGVKKVVCLSTDKAVYPINAMGISKAMMEKVAKDVIVTRYGNVMRSRGSIIPIWEQAAKDGQPLTLTNPDMTRFLLSLDNSIDLVMYAMEHGKPGEIYVKKAPACTMLALASAISNNIKTIGIRHGEKMHETLISQEEMIRTDDLGDYYRINPDDRDMNYDNYFTQGQSLSTEAYTSANTTQLTGQEVKDLLWT